MDKVTALVRVKNRCNGTLYNGSPCKRNGWFTRDGKWACGMHLDQVFNPKPTQEELDQQRQTTFRTLKRAIVNG